MSLPLADQIRHCDDYELAPNFAKWLPAHQPILEAGCGSGRWVAWFAARGWRATGIDWSEALCERARREVPGVDFVAGDMRAMPFADGAFGSIVSLGAIEHDIAGPQAALREYMRVLHDGGIAIVTVPYSGPFHRIVRGVKAALRNLIGKNPPERRAARAQTHQEWDCDLMPSPSGWVFFQYLFSRPQMRDFLANAGCEICEEFVAFRSEGLLQFLGRLIGNFDYSAGSVRLNPLGALAMRLLPLSWCGMMLCYIARKKPSLSS